MLPDKPIFVHHGTGWRPYVGTRVLLESLSIGDVIPILPESIADAPAARYLRTRADACADMISVEPPGDREWRDLVHVAQHSLNTFEYADPFPESTVARMPPAEVGD